MKRLTDPSLVRAQRACGKRRGRLGFETLEIRSMLAADAVEAAVPTPEDDASTLAFFDVCTVIDTTSDDGVDTATDPSDQPLVIASDSEAPDSADSGDGTPADASGESNGPIPDAGFDPPLLTLGPVPVPIDPSVLIPIDLGWVVVPPEETDGLWWPCGIIDPVGPTSFPPDANLPSDDDSQAEGDPAGGLIDADSGSSGDGVDAGLEGDYPIPVDGDVFWSDDGYEPPAAADFGDADLVVPGADGGDLAFFAATGSGGDDQPSDAGSQESGAAVTAPGPQDTTANLFAAFATAFSQGGGDGQGSQSVASGSKRSARR